MAFYSVLYNVTIMFLLMTAGYILIKSRVVDASIIPGLSRMLLLFISPVVIIYAFDIKYTPSLVHGMIVAAVSACCAHILNIGMARVVFNKRTADEQRISVLRYSVAYSNCGFIGIPLLVSLFGKEGAFYASVYMAIFQIFTWTHGVAVFTGKVDSKFLKKLLLNPNIVALAIGMVIFGFQLSLPAMLDDTLHYIFNLNTPLAMLTVGMNLALLKLPSIFTDARVWPSVLIKNFLSPLAAVFILHFAGVSGTLMLACLIPIACPVAGNTVFLAEIYGKDTKFPTRVVSLSTVVSIISVPFIVFVVSMLKY